VRLGLSRTPSTAVTTIGVVGRLFCNHEMARLTEQALSCAARALVPKPMRRDTCRD